MARDRPCRPPNLETVRDGRLADDKARAARLSDETVAFHTVRSVPNRSGRSDRMCMSFIFLAMTVVKLGAQIAHLEAR